MVSGGDTTHLPAGPRTVVVAGDDAGPPARQLAENARWPLLAEPSSGSRTGDSAIRTYRILLGGDLAGRIERVVVFGHPTLSRPVTRLLGSGVEVVSVPPRGRWTERPHPVTRHARAVTADPDETGWFEEWKARDAEVSRALDDLVEADGLGPLAVAREVSAALPPRRSAVRRRLEPDPRPRPDGRPLRGRPAAQGAGQPGAVRDRRHRVQRDRRGAHPAGRAATCCWSAT